MKASLEIQHERWAADRWKVMLRVNGVAFAIGAECATLKQAQGVRTAFKKALFELGINTPNIQGEAPEGLPPPPCSAFPPVLDVCCGPKGMWFDKHDPRALFMDRRRETHVDTYPCGTKTNVIDPCVIGDFSKMDFPDESFRLVVFDPPHIEQAGASQITKKYGSLQGDWREMLRAGFAECLRVLKPEGVLIFKWNECRFPVKDILALTDAKPLFGHKSGKKMQTHWVAFLK